MTSHVDREYSNALTKWKNGKNVSDPENCRADLDTMFNDIKRACDNIEEGDSQVKGKKRRRSHWAERKGGGKRSCDRDSEHAADKNTGKMRDYGLKCQRSDCWFDHPKGWSGGEWKASNHSTMKGNAYMCWDKVDEKKTALYAKGGKGKGKGKSKGKGKCRTEKRECEVEGCKRMDWQRFCTPHYKQGLDKGYLLKKDGEKYEFDSKKRKNEDTKDAFGFERASKQ